jgi:adenylylsulfate kinase
MEKAIQLISHDYALNKSLREKRNGHRAFVLWFTGLSGSGKSTLANLVEKILFNNGKNVYVLDGDIVRRGINKDLDFSKEGRKENIRRVAEIANLFCDAGTITITAFISPFQADREIAKQIVGEENFVEVYLDTPLDTCIARDVKGLYEKAKAGLIKEFTGISDVYERPVHPQLSLNTAEETPEESAGKIISYLTNKGYLLP